MIDIIWFVVLVALPGTVASIGTLIVVVGNRRIFNAYLKVIKADTIQHLTFKIAAAVKEGIAQGEERERRHLINSTLIP